MGWDGEENKPLVHRVLHARTLTAVGQKEVRGKECGRTVAECREAQR